MAGSPYHVISKEVENHITSLDTIEFIDTHVCINNPHWQSSRIIVFLCKYDVVIPDTLLDTFLDVLFLLLTVILSELYETPRRKDWVTEKVQTRICVRDITFLTARLPFLLLSSSTLPKKKNSL